MVMALFPSAGSANVKTVAFEPMQHNDDWIATASGNYSWIRGSTAAYLNEVVADVAKIENYRENFKGSISTILKLLEINLENPLFNYQYRLLHANVITALEVYLGDAFSNTVVNRNDHIQRFIETSSKHRNKTILLSDLFSEMNGLDERVKAELADVLWHNIGLVKFMYENTLGI